MNSCFIGSFGHAEYSSDVDILYLGSMEDLGNIPFEHNFYKGFNQLCIAFPINDKIIQVDFMFTTSFGWSKFVYINSPESKYKGVFRTMLIMAIVVSRTKQTFDNGDYKQVSVRLTSGGWTTVKNSKGKILSADFLTNDPLEICKLVGIDYNKTSTFEEIYDQVKDDERVIQKFNEYGSNYSPNWVVWG